MTEITKGVLGYQEFGLHLNRAPPEYTRYRYTDVVGTESLKKEKKRKDCRTNYRQKCILRERYRQNDKKKTCALIENFIRNDNTKWIVMEACDLTRAQRGSKEETA